MGLVSLDLMPGDRVIYRLEIEDNDSVSGPKVAYSRSFTLSMRDERSRLSRKGKMPADCGCPVRPSGGSVGRDPGTGTAGAKDGGDPEPGRPESQETDKADRFDLEALGATLPPSRRGCEGVEGDRDAGDGEARLLAEDISKKARMKEVEASPGGTKSSERLLDAMQEFKGPLTKEAQEAFMKELRKLEELLHSVMDA